MAKISTLLCQKYFSFSSTYQYNTPVKLSKVFPGERIINLEEVASHDCPSDCWMVIYDRVYDLTDFLDEHPGGKDILLEYAGRDASCAFRGTGHSKVAYHLLSKYLIGELPLDECIFRKPGGLQLRDLPE